MKHTFVLHVTVEIHDEDPTDSVEAIEEAARRGFLNDYEQLQVECVDAHEAELNAVLSMARAAAAPSSVVGPPSTAGGGTGGAQGRRPLGSAGTVQAPPTSNGVA
jgi:hypothetical protein